MKHEAIYSLYSNVVRIDGNTAYDSNGNVVEFNETKVETEAARLQAEYDANEYQRKRASEYPSWGKQLEKIYDDGIDAWKTEMVDPIKAKYPKPGE